MSAVVEKSVAIVGLGSAATPYLEALGAFPELNLLAGVTTDEDRARTLERRGVRVFPCVDALLRARTVPDLAIVCSPPAMHVEHSIPLLRAGADLLVESPLATITEDADLIEATAERIGRVLITAGPLRASLAVLEAKWAISAGKIGRLQSIQTTLATKRDAREGWRADPHLSGGGVWMDLGPRALDLVETLAGPPHRIRMIVCAQRQGAGVEDEAVVETDHGGGIVARMHLNWNGEAEAPIARCIGDAGEILVGWTQTVLRTDSGERVLASGHDGAAACRALITDLLRRRLKSEPPLDHGAQAVAWIHAAYRSLRDHSWEPA